MREVFTQVFRDRYFNVPGVVLKDEVFAGFFNGKTPIFTLVFTLVFLPWQAKSHILWGF